MRKDEDRKGRAVAMCFLGSLTVFVIIFTYIMSSRADHPDLPFFRGLRMTVNESSPFGLFLLVLSLLVVCISVGMFSTPGLRQGEYRETGSRLLLKRVLKKTAAERDISCLERIVARAPLKEVREAAAARRKELLRPCLEQIAAATDLRTLEQIRVETYYPEIRNALAAKKNETMRAVLSSGDRDTVLDMLDRFTGRLGFAEPAEQDILAEAAQRYPELVQMYWTRFTKWAHQDMTRNFSLHDDNGHRYHDCHDDHHTDEPRHTDMNNEDRLARFRPVIPE